MTRRELLGKIGGGFGLLGFAQVAGAFDRNPSDQIPSLAPKSSHFPGKAKQIIYLCLNGGPSQVDTFDPKPLLAKYHGKPLPSESLKTERKTGTVLASPFTFQKQGKCGMDMSDIFPKLGAFADDLCLIRSMVTDRPNHEPSLLMMNSGHPLAGHASMGAWVTYGLGTFNQNLPGFIVLCPGLPNVGPQLWTSAYLPGIYQGTYVANRETDPEKLIRYIRNPQVGQANQQSEVGLLKELIRLHLERQGPDSQLEASIQNLEMAFRMQTEATEAFDIRKEPESVRYRYVDCDFGRGCLLARRLIERGVRMVQVYFGNIGPWDNHDDILVHRKLAFQADGSIAALLQDLKDRGLFESTIVLIGGEFGRTPVVEVSGLADVHNGRDHDPYGFSVLVAGGGFKGGTTYGSTDDFGFKAVENPVHVHDLHATMLHQMGLDHTKLTYRYSSRDFRLTDVAGKVVRDIIS